MIIASSPENLFHAVAMGAEKNGFDIDFKQTGMFLEIE
jgi:hypothetical protein